MQPIALLPVRTSDPTVRIMDVDQANEHLRLEDEDLQDDYVEALIGAVETYLDGFAGVLGRALITQTWARSFDRFPCGDTIRLPLAPLQSVESVMYFDRDGNNLAFGSSNYHAVTDAIGPCVKLADNATWPDTFCRPDAVTITWICGYGDAAADVPESIIHAAKLLLGDYFQNREDVSISKVVASRVDALIAPFRRTPT